MLPVRLLLLGSLASLAIAACTDTDIVEPPPVVVAGVSTVRNLPADTGRTGHYTFFRLRDSSVVAFGDSASRNWDIAFNATSVITNSGDRGPGLGGWQLLTGFDFDTLSSAPADGYATGALASTWYTYTGPTGTPPHAILANPGTVVVLRTADGRYAKLQIVSYYKGAPASPTGTEPARHYTFRYVLQTDGGRSFPR